MDRPISFPNWKAALAQAPLGDALRATYIREILSFLKHCKETRSAATVATAKRYLVWREKQSRSPSREALRWFYREGRRAEANPEAGCGDSPSGWRPADRDERVPAPGLRRPSEPPQAATDLGSEPWEKDLIKAIRERGFLWRTERTYREWTVRFARFIAPRSPYAAAGEDVAAFLSALAVEGRASPSAQKQALNALVFVTRWPGMRAPRLFTLRFAPSQPLTQTAG